VRIQTKKTENISEQSYPECLMNYDICKGIPSIKTELYTNSKSKTQKRKGKKITKVANLKQKTDVKQNPV